VTYAYIVLNFFAAAWCIWGLQAAGRPVWSWVFPAIASLVIGAICLRATAGVPRRSREEGARIGRLIGIWSGIEAAGILVAVNVLAGVGRERLVVPAVAVIVGLHFFPLARGIPAPAYGVLGWALVVLGAGAMLLPGAYPAPVAAFGAAILLWVTCVALVRRALA
jgi:hypothetical protein